MPPSDRCGNSRRSAAIGSCTWARLADRQRLVARSDGNAEQAVQPLVAAFLVGFHVAGGWKATLRLERRSAWTRRVACCAIVPVGRNSAASLPSSDATSLFELGDQRHRSRSSRSRCPAGSSPGARPPSGARGRRGTAYRTRRAPRASGRGRKPAAFWFSRPAGVSLVRWHAATIRERLVPAPARAPPRLRRALHRDLGNRVHGYRCGNGVAHLA